MLEVEAKARVEDLGEIRERLVEKGGVFLGKVDQKDTYFAHPERDFQETDEALRIRESGGRFYLTYKGPKLDGRTKTREELEMEVFEPEKTGEILARLGFERVMDVEKTRESYGLEGFTVTLDTVEGLGTFVEVEKEAEDYTPEELEGVFRELGIPLESMERRSYLELLMENL